MTGRQGNNQTNPAARSEKPITIALVGDVHDAWDADDPVALQHLGVDLVLLVGDFGNEAVEVVRQIVEMPLPKAVILGNHDAWYSASEWGMKKSPYDHTKEDRVQQQLDLLGNVHVGYSKLDFAQFNLSVVGARPFSWGGSEWKNSEFYQTRYGVGSFEESTARIVKAADAATGESIIFLGHCGPLGLGDRPDDPCGKDWHPPGGDHGDPDFAAAIAQTRALGKTIPLAVFGHMHHQLRYTKQTQRKRVMVDAAETVYVNAASVPRIRRDEETCRRNFTLVTLQHDRVTEVALVWIDQQFQVDREVLYRQTNPMNEPLPEEVATAS